MPGGGTRTFFEPDHYEADLGQAKIGAVILPHGKFRARQTWAELHHLQVVRCEEDSPGIAYVQLAPELAFVTFSVDSGPLPVWRGIEMLTNDIVFHRRGDRLHCDACTLESVASPRQSPGSCRIPRSRERLSRV